MRHIVPLIFLGLACESQVGERLPADQPRALVPCYQDFVADVGDHFALLPVDPARADRVGEIATEWALANGYLPCVSYQMCVAAFARQDKQILVLIRPLESSPGEISPAAELLLSADASAILSSETAHTGCAIRESASERT